MSTTLPHGIIQINEGNISWYGDITANWQLIDSKIGIYDAAIATIPAPANNGTLTINYGGTTLAMFGADDAGNVTADIPAPGDGTLTVTQGGSTLGSFTANQAAAGTIDIPTPGDGTLTVTQGGSTLGTFNANQAANSLIAIPAPGAGVLTVTVDGITAGTFSANQSTSTTIALTSSGGGAAIQPMSVSIAHGIAVSVFGA